MAAKTKPNFEDANLILRLYELRREEKLRRARQWLFEKFNATTAEDFQRQYPMGSEENAYFRMVSSYWEMAAGFVVKGIVDKELFFQNSGELFGFWEKARPLILEFRQLIHNPLMGRNTEQVATEMRQWFETQAPGAYEAMKQMMQQQAAQSHSATN